MVAESSPSERPFLDLRRGGSVATLVLDRPARRNAVDLAGWRAIATAMRGLAGDPLVRAVIVTGAGTDFCAGADISGFDTERGDTAAALRYEAANSEAFAAIRDHPVPTIAAIRGVCFGGGFGLAAACDLRVAAPDAVFAVPAARLGLAYPVDDMADIVAALGSQRAAHLAFTGERLDAAAALGCGFLLELVEAPDPTARAMALAETIAANAPLSVAASKAAIRAARSRLPADRDRAVLLGEATFESAD